jgi:hypothetical protein
MVIIKEYTHSNKLTTTREKQQGKKYRTHMKAHIYNGDEIGGGLMIDT